ncbi:hypothetical protein FN846DRAFT_887404 [Sphaerosporella brunnea]|uniref:Uncharacterized protein n=1 Tax=Sphaerosporella brunnea TaxID=1250544 RepID=A0A5J5F670_9PEZI|nr:hypothetical protein FN846DRAFT_887404 [Sphaerosporella brunnea]
MPDTATTASKRARNTQEAESRQKRVKAQRLQLYKDHNRMYEQLGIPPRDKEAILILRRELQDLCKQHEFKLTRNYCTWGADVMRKLVKTVTAQLNADPKWKKVISTVAVDALVHSVFLDNVRNMKAAKEKQSNADSVSNVRNRGPGVGWSLQQDDEEDRNSKDKEDDGDEDTPAAPTEPPYAQQQAVETDMDNEAAQDDKEFRHLGGGKWSVNDSHAEIDEQPSNQLADMPNGHSNGQTRLAKAHHHEIRLPPCRPVRDKCDDDTRSGRESRPCELNPAPEPLPPVRAKYNDDTGSMNNGRESQPCELNPASKPLPPAATVPQDTVPTSLPQASQYDTRISILVDFSTQSSSPLQFVIPRDKPFHLLYRLVTYTLPCDFDRARLLAIVPETTEMVYLDTDQDWMRLTARTEVVRLKLVIELIDPLTMKGEIPIARVR